MIQCTGGTGNNVGRINPLQIRNIDIEEENTKRSKLSMHFQTLSTFFKLYYPEMKSVEQALLDQVLEDLYKRFNIDWNTDISKISNEKYPIMLDLYKLLESIDISDKNQKIHFDNLRAIVRKLAIRVRP